MNIRQEAEKIVYNGNGYGIKCADILAIPEELRQSVWNEIIKIGQEDSESCQYCGGY